MTVDAVRLRPLRPIQTLAYVVDSGVLFAGYKQQMFKVDAALHFAAMVYLVLGRYWPVRVGPDDAVSVL